MNITAILSIVKQPKFYGTIAVVIISLLIILLIKVFKNLNRPMTLVLCGMPNSGKTRFFQYLMNQSDITTVKSAQQTLFTGHLLGNVNREVTLVDFPSDERVQKFDLKQATRIAFFCAQPDKPAAMKLAQTIVQLKPSTVIYVDTEEAQFYKELDKQFAAVNGVDEAVIENRIVRFDCGQSVDEMASAAKRLLE